MLTTYVDMSYLSSFYFKKLIYVSLSSILLLLVMVRASEKLRAKKIMPRACPSFQKAWLDRAELLKTRGSRA